MFSINGIKFCDELQYYILCVYLYECMYISIFAKCASYCFFFNSMHVCNWLIFVILLVIHKIDLEMIEEYTIDLCHIISYLNVLHQHS